MEKNTIKIDGVVIEYDNEALVEALKEANANAWRYRGCQYSVYLWDDGDITSSESFAGDNARLAAAEAHCIYTITHQNDHPEDFDIDWQEDVVSRLSDEERAEYQKLIDEDEDTDEWLRKTAAYSVHYDELVEWLATDSEDFDAEAIIENASDARWS